MGKAGNGYCGIMGCVNNKPKHSAKVSADTTMQEARPAIDYSSKHENKILTDIYRMGNGLGKGAFAEVKKCEHKATREDRAVKIYRKDPANPALRSNIMREFDILRTLDHPNIVGIFEHFEDDRKFYMVMEYCKGGEMFNSIVKGANTNEEMVARTMRQVLSAIAYIHENGIVHRDMKPENILFEELGNEQNLKLVDFGEATRLDENRQVEGVCGTSYYVAPEVLTGRYNELCDIWSCGVIMYILLSGKVPFNGHNDSEIIEKVKLGVYRIDTPEFINVSHEAIDLIQKMISPWETRIAAKVALQHPWMVKFLNIVPDEDKMNTCMNNLTKYVRGALLREAVTRFVVTRMLTRGETKKIRDIFLKLNESGTAQLVPSELIKYYSVKHPGEKAASLVQQIFTQLDPTHSGSIEFKSFLCGVVEAADALSRRAIESALTVFAVETGGKANVVEMRRMLHIEPERLMPAWESVIDAVQKNGAGDIDMNQLVDVVYRKVQDS